MQNLNEQLDNEFKQLGFENYTDMYRLPKTDGAFTFFHSSETIPTVVGEGTGKVVFSFAVVEPEKNKPFIEFIRTTIEVDVRQHAGVLINLEKRWRKAEQPLPTKERMIDEIYTGFRLAARQFENVNKVCETFRMGKRPDEPKEITKQTQKGHRL